MNTPESQKTVDSSDGELARELLDYLAEDSGAMDTLQGIAEWWLLRQRVRMVVRQVERVLLRLTAEGALEAVGSGPTRRYRLRRDDGRAAD